MKEHMLKLLHEAEGSWWYKGRAAVVAGILRKFSLEGHAGSALDFGGGFGGMFGTLKRFSGRVYAFEPDPIAQKALRERGYAEVFDTPEAALKSSYDITALFDVIEHIKDDKKFLAGLAGALSSGGRVVLTAPAYQWLWSEHDVANHHFRRYTKASLTCLLREAGFTVEYAGYWNTLLFLPAAITRLFGVGGGGALLMPPAVDRILLRVVRIEVALMRLFPLPFGLSVVVVASKAA